MALNNLRIVYQNIADVSTITSSSVAGTATPAINLQKDIKSYVYRSASASTTAIKTNLVLQFSSKTFTNGVGVILTVCNLTSAATIRVRGYTGSAPTTGSGTNPAATPGGTQQFDSGTVLAAPYQNLGFSNWDTDSYYDTTLNTTRYTDRKVYARVWVPLTNPIACTSILIEISDTNVNQYIEASRLIVGDYWSPKFNTSYGLSAGVKDLSTKNRSEAGDLLSTEAPKYGTLTFDLKWLTKQDRTQLNKIVKLLGTQRPLFVSLFPSCSEDWEKEQLYQIYGKISELAGLDHSIFEMYGSQLDIEEI